MQIFKLLFICIFFISASAQAKHSAKFQETGDKTWNGLVQPLNWKTLAKWDNRPVRTALPVKWDWRDMYVIQAIRDQGSCGSCWSFGVIGATEAVHRILYPMLYPIIDLAEQTLVSTCCGSGDCGGGYFDAFNYIRDKGLPVESEDPYRASNSSCKSGLHPFIKISSWHYVGSENGGATTEQIKQAIYDHGPVTIDINGGFSGYDGRSIFTGCGSTSTNHMVVLTGWVDDPAYAAYGGGYWILRNSWGSEWGENGYMRIVYNKKNSQTKCNGAGEVTAYSVINGVENIREPNMTLMK